MVMSTTYWNQPLKKLRDGILVWPVENGATLQMSKINVVQNGMGLVGVLLLVTLAPYSTQVLHMAVADWCLVTAGMQVLSGPTLMED